MVVVVAMMMMKEEVMECIWIVVVQVDNIMGEENWMLVMEIMMLIVIAERGGIIALEGTVTTTTGAMNMIVAQEGQTTLVGEQESKLSMAMNMTTSARGDDVILHQDGLVLMSIPLIDDMRTAHEDVTAMVMIIAVEVIVVGVAIDHRGETRIPHIMEVQ